MSNARNLANLLGTKTKVKDVDVDGTALILDADGDTSIEASSDDIIVFDTAGSERVRLDADGNLLSGKASTAFGTVGHRISPTGFAHHTRTGGSNGTDPCLGLNLLSNDGNLVEFYKDSSQVGSIGVADGDNLTISSTASAHGGLKFNNTAMSAYVDGASSNGTMDIGTSVVSFRDLYLSGGVFIGGTGTSNKLEDYEEGTWTPGITYDGGQTATMSQTSGVYTKVGRIVHCTGMLKIGNKNSGTGDVFLTGLPFTVADSVSNTSLEGNGVIGYYATLSGSVNTMTVTPVNSDTKCEVYTGVTGATSTRASVSQFDNNAQIRFSFNYAV